MTGEDLARSRPRICPGKSSLAKPKPLQEMAFEVRFGDIDRVIVRTNGNGPMGRTGGASSGGGK